jgi:hypothetical protein
MNCELSCASAGLLPAFAPDVTSIRLWRFLIGYSGCDSLERVRLDGLFPQAKAALRCIVVVTGPASWGQVFQFFRVAASHHYFIRLNGGAQARYHVCDMSTPLLLALI